MARIPVTELIAAVDVVMYPNYNYPNGPSGSAGYPYMQQPLLPPMQPPMQPPMVPPGYNEEYAQWAQWNSHFGAMNPTTTWRNQAASTLRQTPYDRPVTIQHQVPYGGRPYVPRDLSGPNANTVRDSYGGAAVASSSSGPSPAAAANAKWEVPPPPVKGEAPPVPAALNNQKAPEVFYNNIAPNLEFDVNVSSTRLDIVWKPPHVSGKITYEVSIAEGGGVPWTLVFPKEHTRHSMRAKAGESYTISITAKKVANGVTVAEGNRKIKAIFSEQELRQLFDKAVKYTGSRMHPFQILYRCKPKPYWDDIHHNCNNVMEKYMKDDNGQPANMINGVISGLFFSARLLPNGTLPCSSPFGNVRMLVQAIMLLDPTNVNLYFADFYCNKQAHYVTIIVARKDSESDVYSRKYLIQLDMKDNPWLKYVIRPDGDQWKFLFYAAHSVWIEVLYTENVPLNWGRFDKIAATGLGTSKIGGLSNNKSCTVCNLYPPGARTSADEPSTSFRGERPSAASAAAPAAAARILSPEKKGRWRNESFHEDDANRSISPGLLPEDDEVEAPESDRSRDEDDDGVEIVEEEDDEDVDGVPLPAYEMGGNSTFQTMLNMRNVHDAPHWTDVIECACDIVDRVVTTDQKEREREITSFNSACDLRVERAIEEMDSIVGGCDDDKIHDLAGEVHELAERWQRARAELAKLMEARDARAEQARAARAMAPLPPPQAPPPAAAAPAASQQKDHRRPIKEEDLDEYLDDDDDVITKKEPSSTTTPSAVKEIPLPPPPPSWPLNLAAKPTTVATAPPTPATVFPVKQPATVTLTTVTPTTTLAPPRPSSFLAALAPQTFGGGTVATTPPQVTVAPADSSPMRSSSRQKKKDRKPSKVKEEELDEYLEDDDGPTVSTMATVSSTVGTVTAPKAATVTPKREIKKEAEPTRVDPLNDSAIDLSLLDEVGATPARKITVATAPKKNTVITIDEGEDEWLDEEEEDTVGLKRSATECSSSSSSQAPPPPPAVPQKRVKIDEIEYIDLTEDELLAGAAGDVIDITPEMEEELLRG